MKFKISGNTVGVLCLVIAATIAAIFAEYYRKDDLKQTAPVKRLSQMPSFSPESVTKIEIGFGPEDKKLLLFRSADSWRLRFPGRPEFYASSTKLAVFLESLSKTKFLREFSLEPQEAETLSLADYQEGKALNTDKSTGRYQYYFGVSLKLFDKNDKKLLDIMLGAAHYKPEEILSAGQSMQVPDGRYLRVNLPNGEKHYLLMSQLFEQCAPMPGLWIEHLRFNTMSQPVQMEFLRNRTSVWQLKQAEDGAYGLLVPAGSKLASGEIEKKIKLLSGAFTRDLAPADAIFTPDCKLILEMNNGFTYTLEMQDSRYNEMQRYARMKIHFDAEKVHRLKSETEEQFSVRTDRLRKNAEIEKKWFEKHLFVLQPDVITILEKIPGA